MYIHKHTQYTCTNKMHKINWHGGLGKAYADTSGKRWTSCAGQVLYAAPCNSKDKLLFIIIEVKVRYMSFQRPVVAGLNLRPLNMMG